jgi:predicted lipoprotein
MNRKLFVILLVAVALVAAASVYADQAAERNALSAIKEKPENVKTDIWAAGNIYFGNPYVDQRASRAVPFRPTGRCTMLMAVTSG